MIPGQFATHQGRTVQVLHIQGGQSRHWGGSTRIPTVYTLKPWPEGETYTVEDPGADLRTCQTPEGYQPALARPVPLCGDQSPHTPHRVQVGMARSDCQGAW